jgi:hypothetical protein
MGHQEQSVDDILASIRRIIADDVPDTRSQHGERDHNGTAGGDEPQPTVEVDDMDDDDEPLLLSEPAPDPAPHQAVAGSAGTSGAAGQGTRSQHDVLLLTEPLDPVPGTSDNPPPPPSVSTGRKQGARIQDPSPGHSAPDRQGPDPSPAAHAHPPRVEREGVVSGQTREAVAEAFSQLASQSAAAKVRDAYTKRSGDETLEDLVRMALKPVLRDWLDRNLPGMVQTIVEREISRLKDSDRI